MIQMIIVSHVTNLLLTIAIIDNAKSTNALIIFQLDANNVHQDI